MVNLSFGTASMGSLARRCGVLVMAAVLLGVQACGRTGGPLAAPGPSAPGLASRQVGSWTEFPPVPTPQLPGPTPAVPLPVPGQGPVLCVPGYLDLDFYFAPLRRTLREAGRESEVLHLFPNIGDIRLSARRLAERVEQLRAGRPERLELLAHSEGGLIARYYIRFLGGDRAVKTLVTLATPHKGTYVAYLGPGEAGRQMRPGSDLLRELNEGDPSWGDVRYVAIRGGLDEIVLPHSSMELEGAENLFVRFVDHATIFTSPTVAGHVRRAFGRPD